ncbi:hypothetical protein MVEG_11569 [Podila verticillata NRRL 6337]|uniref:Peptidase S8/S53 domain-containing protein n=1 Tax=Podila verticillata NRRL 6337 TaxID=1069443 RepID=A0A086TK82_9FUNG|nr:hypothetical protein MVEG_11569 [Podila verticillata NRRL 6337]
MKITAILSALAATTLVSAGTFHIPKGQHTANTVPNAFIVEYDDKVSHGDFHNSLNSHNIGFKVRNEYNIFNGASVTVTSDHKGEALAKLPGVKNVWPVQLRHVPKTKKSTKKPTDPEVVSDHHMTGVDVVHKKYKLTGKGVKIGVIDTGLDYNHPAFAAAGANAGCFARNGKNCRVAHGWDFVGDDYDGTNTPKPDADPMDCFGHGTHVAGIIGGNALNIKVSPKPPQPFVGVAPEVTFGAYRVFGCKGTAGNDIIMSAMELAFNDGMDVINMSLGGGSDFKYNAEAVLAEKLIARGMALAAAAGNDGENGVWMVSDTGLGDSSSSVASFDNAYGAYYSVSYGGVAHPYSISTKWNKVINLPASATLVPIFEKDGSLSDGCDASVYAGKDVKGKVVLVVGDTTRCLSGGRGANGVAAGAAGMLIQTTPYGIASLGGTDNFPMGGIEFQAGEDLLAIWKKTPASALTWSTAQSSFLVEGGGTPSSFSSFGTDGELRSKPDVAAPGGNILSTLPLAQGGYGLMSGTSMATPYVAGSHALLIQAKHAKPRGDEIRKIFKNTATISSNFQSKTKTSAAKQGAGLINVLNAITATATISPDHIDLLDTNHFQGTQKITIKNTGKHTETYTLSHIAADALNSYPDAKKAWPLATPLVEPDYATVSFSSAKVKVPAGKSVKVTLKFKEPKAGNAAQFPIYSGYVVATPSSKGGVAVHVPYLGVKGDIAKVPIADTDLKFPQVATVDAQGNMTDLPKGPITFDLKTNTPAVLIRLGSHTPDRQIRVYDDKKNFKGFVYTADLGAAFGYKGRDTYYDSNNNLVFSAYVWKDAKVVASENSTEVPVSLPDGTYNIVSANQHKLSKGAYPADFEVFDLGSFKIARA